MNLPTEIPALEAELNHVLRMYEEDQKRLAQSTTPEIDRIFFASTKKLRHEIEEHLHRAKERHRTLTAGTCRADRHTSSRSGQRSY